MTVRKPQQMPLNLCQDAMAHTLCLIKAVHQTNRSRTLQHSYGLCHCTKSRPACLAVHAHVHRQKCTWCTVRAVAIREIQQGLPRPSTSKRNNKDCISSTMCRTCSTTQASAPQAMSTFLDPEGSLIRVTPVSGLCATMMA